jgi:predicted Zn-dependent protease
VRRRALLLLALAGLLIAPLRAQDEPDTLGRGGKSPLPDDVAEGLQVAMSLAHSIGVVDSTEWTARLNDIGYRVAAATGDEKTPYSFAVLDLDEPNALALPGGFVFVTRAMMKMDLADDELAHLLGHEISHVRQRHFERAARLNAVLSLAQAAVTMGVLMSARNGGSTQRASVSEDPGLRNNWAVGMTGTEAVVQASALFGSVLQALFERGYSRSLELEADEAGERLAVRAGYTSEAGVGLLTKLRARSFEGRRYSYWRTHPFFDERVARARARAARHTTLQAAGDDTAFRERIAVFFASSAGLVHEEDQALFLYRRALQCEPRRLASQMAALQLVRFKRQRDEREMALRHGYGGLIASYDSLIARAERDDPQWAQLPSAREERDALDRERADEHGAYLTAIAHRDVPTDVLEHFIENFPADSLRVEASYRLGVHYALAEKPSEAVARLVPLAEGGGAWADSALAALLRTIPALKEMTDCCRLVGDSTATDSARVKLAAVASRRLDELTDADLSLEQGSRFLAACPESPWTPRVREKMAAKAAEAYRNGRVQEGMHRYQEALDAYYSVLAYAPDTSSAADAQEAIDRLHRAPVEEDD